VTALRSRLDCLEKAQVQKVHGRFIYVRSGRCTEQEAHEYLRGVGVTVGPRDLVLLETFGDPGTAGHISPGEQRSHDIIECTERFEDMLARLEVEC
jgi:hypothetical protein